jgi:hypothetical protein
MSPDIRASVDEVLDWPLWRVLAANDLIDAIDAARTAARVEE